jgi:hypothetical protein
MILSNVPLKFLARWSYLDRFGRGVRPETEVPGFDPSRALPANAETFARWISETTCDAIVWIDLLHDSPWYVPVPGCAGLAQYRELLERQSKFVQTKRLNRSGATITIWSRSEPNYDSGSAGRTRNERP